MRSLTRFRPARSLLLVAALWLAAGHRAAQSSDDAAKLRQAGSVLRERSRTTMNPAENPLTVIGLEQGANDLRTRTPALLSYEPAPTLLDPKAAYARALALYEGEAFSSAPPKLAPEPRRRPAVEPPMREEKAEPARTPAPYDHRKDWRTVVPSLLLGALVVGWLFRRTARSMVWPSTAGR